MAGQELGQQGVAPSVLQVLPPKNAGVVCPHSRAPVHGDGSPVPQQQQQGLSCPEAVGHGKMAASRQPGQQAVCLGVQLTGQPVVALEGEGDG